jgi:hypothetical protein
MNRIEQIRALTWTVAIQRAVATTTVAVLPPGVATQCEAVGLTVEPKVLQSRACIVTLSIG